MFIIPFTCSNALSMHVDCKNVIHIPVLFLLHAAFNTAITMNKLNRSISACTSLIRCHRTTVLLSKLFIYLLRQLCLINIWYIINKANGGGRQHVKLTFLLFAVLYSYTIKIVHILATSGEMNIVDVEHCIQH